MVRFNEAKEPETLEYRLFISQDEKHLSLIETYSNSEALLFHDYRLAKNFADEISSLTSATRLCIYGNVFDH